MKKQDRGERRAAAHCCAHASKRVRNQQAAGTPRSSVPNREGSTLMIVIALLAMLALVGVVFYTFAAQERSNAEYFAEARKADADGGQPADFLFDWALRQLIVGPEDYERQSVLWGANHSMVPNMFGRDAHPYSGAGVNIILYDEPDNNPMNSILDTAEDFNNDGIRQVNEVAVDQNYNGLPDDGTNGEPDNRDLLDFNISPLARNGAQITRVNGKLVYPGGTERFPGDIDVDYTYPDGNNLFASYHGRGLDTSVGVGSASRFRRVIIPSFHRPQYLRSGGAVIPNWWSAPSTSQKVMRPHPDHLNLDGSRRYYGADGAPGGTGVNADFPFQPGEIANALTLGQMGIWTNWGDPTQDDVYELDVDNDGDNIKEGIWMDLGHPIQELADGTTYVPLFSYTVIDADALLNINVHGNSPRIDNLTIDGTVFGGGQFISKSNQGVTPGEVNLQYAFHANPAVGSWDFQAPKTATDLSNALEQYRLFFGRDPASRQELSNMEFFFLTRGRPEFSSASSGTQADVTDLYPGRYGEHLSTLFNAIRPTAPASMQAGNFPKPGRTGVNDQGAADSNIDNPQFIQPFAYNGLGSYWQSAAYRVLDLHHPYGASTNPSVWLRYSGYQVKSNPFWWTAAGNAPTMNSLMGGATGATGGAELDDAMETIFERSVEQTSDAIFGPSETAYTQLSQTDRATINVTPRLDQLLPFSQGSVETASRRAASKRLTAQSWDRKQYGFPLLLPGQRDWEFNRDTDGDTFGDTFPPTFRPSGWDASATGTWDTGTNREPFRPSLTSLLALVTKSTQRGRPQFRLNLNQLLYSPGGGGLAYRQLTNPATNWQQAQLDRQKMCRDIYVLLYTLGGGNDNKNYANINDHSGTMTAATGDFVYTPAQLRQMAQFAVNVVDAMDRDRVITVFEYDKNLGKTVNIADETTIVRAGWNLDDNPRTNDDDGTDSFNILSQGDTGYNANYPGDSIERGVVYGVEAQLLTLSESLWVRVPEDSSRDSQLTLYDEMTGPHEHMFIELRNASPFPIAMGHSSSTTANTATWRLRVKYNAVTDSGTGMVLVPEETRTLSFLRNAGPYNGGTVLQPNVEAGAQFTIGASNGQDQFPSNEYRPADLRIDSDGTADGSGYPLIVPALSGGTPPTAASTASQYGNPWTDLDLVHSRDETLKFAINGNSNPATNKGILLNGIDSSVLDYTLILERRADLDRPTLNTTTENPWVEVDRMQVQAKVLTTNMTTEMDIVNELAKLTSSERRQPLMRRSTNSETQFGQSVSGAAGPPAGYIAANQYNTIGYYRNSLSPTQFTTWQQHFDRDFTSVGELLSIPLYGPRDVTKHASGSQSSSDNWSHRPPRQEFNTGHYPLTAASLMLQPQYPSNIGNSMADVNLDNRWYRLLEFVEVPTRTHLGLGNPLNLTRVPGRLQWNMMRNPESWVALLDDSNVVNLGANYLSNPTTGYAPMPDVGGGESTTRDWWEQMIRARDRYDPVTQLYVPGTASSRPFRSLSYVAAGNNSVEHTMLRQLPNDESNANSHRRLLEIGNATEHQNGSVDPYIRHRLLSKAWGNSTNRSHVFVVFISVDYFNAADLGGGAIGIGDRLDSSSVEHRGVFVVNRAQIEEAINRGNRVNWRKLVDFRQTIK